MLSPLNSLTHSYPSNIYSIRLKNFTNFFTYFFTDFFTNNFNFSRTFMWPAFISTVRARSSFISSASSDSQPFAPAALAVFPAAAASNDLDLVYNNVSLDFEDALRKILRPSRPFEIYSLNNEESDLILVKALLEGIQELALSTAKMKRETLVALEALVRRLSAATIYSRARTLKSISTNACLCNAPPIIHG